MGEQHEFENVVKAWFINIWILKINYYRYKSSHNYTYISQTIMYSLNTKMLLAVTLNESPYWCLCSTEQGKNRLMRHLMWKQRMYTFRAVAKEYFAPVGVLCENLQPDM